MYSTDYDAEAECLVCRISGDLNLELVGAIKNEMASLLRKHGYRRVLSDLREANVKLSTLDLYNIPKLLEDAGFSGRVKRALVVSGPAKDASFYETTSLNRGHSVKIFRDPEEAKRWLLKTPAKSPPSTTPPETS